MAGVVSIALVVFISGWMDGVGAAAQGNAMDTLSGFTTMQKCKAAADQIAKGAINSAIVKTVCVDSGLPETNPAPGQKFLVLMTSSWQGGAGARGNAITHLRTSAEACSAAGEQAVKASHKPEMTRSICVEL